MGQVRKAKALLELNLVRDIKGNNKGFYRYIRDKRKNKETVDLLWKEIGNLITQDMENSEVFNDIFLPWSSRGRAHTWPRPQKARQRLGEW